MKRRHRRSIRIHWQPVDQLKSLDHTLFPRPRLILFAYLKNGSQLNCGIPNVPANPFVTDCSYS